MSNETKQTAVDIAFQKLANSGLLVTRDYKNIVAYREAKEIEKQQMCKFAYKCHNHYKVNGDFKIEQYYDLTYGGNK
jgi:hypothetical protein